MPLRGEDTKRNFKHAKRPRVTAESLKQLAGLTNLERFIITLPVQAEIRIEDGAVANMVPLIHLRELGLAQTRIKSRTLGAFRELRSLDLTNTRLDDATGEALRTGRPDYR